MKTSALTTAERLSLVTAVKAVIQSNDQEAQDPEAILSMLDEITDEHLLSYLAGHGFDTYRQTVMHALFSDIPMILEENEKIEGAAYDNVDMRLEALDEKLHTMRPNVTSVFELLSSGKDVTVFYSYFHPTTNELIYVRKFDVNGHSAQRRAALACEVNMYHAFPEYIDWEINLLKGIKENLPSK